jgi:hypothetical protein
MRSFIGIQSTAFAMRMKKKEIKINEMKCFPYTLVYKRKRVSEREWKIE